MEDNDRRLISGFIYDILENCETSLNPDKYMSFSITWDAKKTAAHDDKDIQSLKSDNLSIENINTLLIKNLEITIDGKKFKSD